MREKRKYLSTVGQLMPRALRIPGAKARMQQWRFLARWEEMAGRIVAAHARPARWQGKVLVVRVDQAVWMTELSFIKQQLMERLKDKFPGTEIKDIRFEIGELPPLPERTSPIYSRIKTSTLCSDEIEFIERAIERIKDTDVRDAARQAMMRSFERRKNIQSLS